MRRAAAAALALAMVSSVCATTYDVADTTEQRTTTTTLPSGSAAELMPRLVDASGRLGAAIVAGSGDTELAQQISDLWAAVAQEVGRDRPELLGDFEANVRRCGDAVRLSRPADADAAHRNLTALVGAFLG